jgi:hypothetical protein
MRELGVPADRDQLGAFFLELLVPLCQSGKLGRSDEGEIGRVEEQDRPFSRLSDGREVDLAEVAFDRIERLDLEVGHALTDPQSAYMLIHGKPPSGAK